MNQKEKAAAGKAAAEKQDAVYTKQQLVKSKRFADCRDILMAVLPDGGQFTVSAAQTAVNTFLKGKVK